MKRKIPVILGLIQIFVAIGAIPAGLSMISQPDGSGLGMTTSLLIRGPFPDFFIPGLFLFIFNGLFNLASGIISFLRNKYTGLVSLFLSLLLIFWVCVQVYVTGLISFMQPLFFFIGLFELILAIILIIKYNKS